jgi:4-cresol dehydrogenase (hydroxylating)
LFVQSNFGVVTKMGLWLMPEPEATLGLAMQLQEPDDVGWAVDELAPLRLNGVLLQSPSIGNSLRIAASQSQRSQWYDGAGAMPDDVLRQVLRKFGLGWWNIDLRLYGYDDVNEAHARIIKNAFAKHTKQEFKVTKWHRGEPIANSGAGVPSTNALQIVNWRGGRGGHLGFSPVMPPTSEHVLKQFHNTKKRYEEIGVDYYGSFTLMERYTTNVNLMVYDQDDSAMTAKVRALFKVLVADAAKEGYSEYRTHLSYMDDVALTFDYNNHALLRLNETVKDALDPNGILAPGKQGIWPKSFRSDKT